MVDPCLNVGAAMIALVIITILVLGALAVFLFVFWILMIIDAAQRRFKSDAEKIVWILILIFLGILGALIYYFVIKKPNRR